ncbi:MAG TPA: 30S ribosomal protein S21 [Candidatus Paceibacterota bacterium]|nr:30S ribosomal protein S21 [Candidatus Paceibacterota bacterium]HOL53824.1 30S ribosomal protein S21 [Candidatus Paceibacterota bacterium]HPP16912.1 30S ribosomal protein S21 [Candidatus Paceibacterota bacterium]
MPIEVTRKPNESINNFLLRFNRALKQAGILDEAKARRFYQPEPNRTQKKKSAIYRAQMRERIIALKKRGVIKGKEDIKVIKKLLRNPKWSYINLPR